MQWSPTSPHPEPNGSLREDSEGWKKLGAGEREEEREEENGEMTGEKKEEEKYIY